jgi:hypothetical protein
MLHMVVATHGPETCAAVIPEIRAKAESALKRMDEVGKKLGVTVKGGWGNMPGHVMYMVCDAPNAHVVDQMTVELQLMDWSTVVVSPVITFDEILGRLQQRK